jgi:hypothetical protein
LRSEYALFAVTEHRGTGPSRNRGELAFAYLVACLATRSIWSSRMLAIDRSTSGEPESMHAIAWGAGLELNLLPFLSGRLETLHFDSSEETRWPLRARYSSISNSTRGTLPSAETVVRAELVIHWR